MLWKNGWLHFFSLSINNPFKVGELLYPRENLPLPSGSQSCQGNHIKTVDNNTLKDVQGVQKKLCFLQFSATPPSPTSLLKTFNAMQVYSQSYWLVIFCTTNSSGVLARERWQTFKNSWEKNTIFNRFLPHILPLCLTTSLVPHACAALSRICVGAIDLSLYQIKRRHEKVLDFQIPYSDLFSPREDSLKKVLWYDHGSVTSRPYKILDRPTKQKTDIPYHREAKLLIRTEIWKVIASMKKEKG